MPLRVRCSSTEVGKDVTVVAAISLWNTVQLEGAIETLRGQGEGVPDSLLEHISPLAREHIGRTGDSVWAGG